MDHLKAFIVCLLVALPGYAQDSQIVITIKTQQTDLGAGQNKNTVYLFPNSNGVFPDISVGEGTGGWSSGYSTQVVRAFGWEPITAGFWYQQVIIDTNSGTAQTVGPWTRGTITVTLGANNNFEVSLSMGGASGATIYPLLDFASNPSNNPPLDFPDAWARISYDPEDDPADVVVSKWADVYCFIKVQGVATAGWMGGSGGAGGDNPGDPGEGELPDGSGYSFTNPNTDGLTGGVGGWLFALDIKTMDLELDTGGRDYVASISDGFNGTFFSSEWDFSWYINSAFKAVGDAVLLGFAGWRALLLPINALKKR